MTKRLKGLISLWLAILLAVTPALAAGCGHSTHTIEYDIGGATPSISAQTITNDDQLVLSEAAQHLTHYVDVGGQIYVLTGWEATFSGGVIDDITSSTKIGTLIDQVLSTPGWSHYETIPLTAQWTAGAKITFDTDGGTSIAPIIQAVGTPVTPPSSPPTKPGYTFDGWDTAIPSTMPDENMTIKALWTENSSGTTPGGSTPAPPVVAWYRINVEAAEHGTVTSSHIRACSGQRVTLTPAPEDGYCLYDLQLTTGRGRILHPTKMENGSYTFQMPPDKVIVSALFLPDRSTSRADLVHMLWTRHGSPVVNYLMDFSDVDQEAWYAEAVRWADSQCVVLGYMDNTFRPDQNLSRQQLATILWRYAQHLGCDVSVGENTNLLSYDDALSVKEYAIPAMQWAVGSGMMAGREEDGKMLLEPALDCPYTETYTLLEWFSENILN